MEKYFLYYFLFLSVLTINTDAKSIIDSSYSLPKSLKPVRYILTMEPDLNVKNDSSTYSGSVTIELKTSESTSNITLHARALNISENVIKITTSNGIAVKFSNTSIDKEREFLIIHLENKLLKDEYYNLTIENFFGNLKYDNIGFYLVKYVNTEGQDRHMAITDFEPSDARKAFPCFDEPAMKATFLIKLIRPKGFNSLSNEELMSTEHLGDGRYLDTFKETVIMPTYVVAFMVSEFKHTSQKERHRIFARPAAIEDGKLDYALSVAVETLQVLEKFTGINYTNSKMDQIAVPDKYFSDEAMENWGLVTFSEKHLFISNETSTTEDIQRCTTYIAHEFGHQWFGNLVTFTDWKYIWLSEGFGTFLQYYIASLVKPSWRLMDQFVLQTVHKVLEYDVTPKTEPMNYQPKYLGSIPSPWICYFKASSVIRMAQHFLTEDIFRRGLQIYLEKNKFGAAEPSDLYRAFQEVIDEKGAQKLLGNNSVSTILGTWDSNAGYPLITVSRNYKNGSIIISQNRYFEDKKDKSDSIWYVPISYAFQSNSNQNFSDTAADLWLTERTTVFNENFNINGWLLVNKQQTGFFRINYDLTNWNRLAAFLNTEDYGVIHVVNRAQLIYDAFHFAELGTIPYEVPLNLSKYLMREKDYIAITPFVNALDHLNLMMASSKTYNIFKDYVVNLLSTAYDHLGFDEKANEAHLDKLNRISILKWLCNFGHSECRNNALKKLREWKETNKFSVSPNLESRVLCGAMRNAPIEDWEYLYTKIDIFTGSKKNVVLAALACSEDKNILKEFLDRLSNTTMFTFEGRMTVRSIANSGNIGLNVVFDYLKNHTELPERYQSMFGFDLGERFTTEEQLKQLETLITTHSGNFEYGIKLVRENLEWIDKGYTKQIEKWLLEYYSENRESSNIV